MRIRSPLIACSAVALLFGCSKGPTPEQQQADVAFAKAKTYAGRGENREARWFLLTARSLDEKLGRSSKVAEEERMLADLYAAAASFDSAFAFYSLSSEQYRNLADRQTVQSITLDIASLQRQMGEDRKALGLYTEGLRLARVFGDETGAREIEWAMIPACRALDQFDDASRFLDDLMKGAAARGDLGEEARVFFESGLSLYAQARMDTSAAMFERAYAVAMQAGDSTSACTSLLRLAMAYDAGGKTREALQSYGDGLRMVDRLRNGQQLRMELLCRVGNLYLRNQRTADAARFYRAAMTSALAAHNRIAEGYLTIQLGHCDLETSRDAAEKSYRSGFDLFTSLPYPPGASYALVSLGLAAQRDGQAIQALQYYKSAVEQSEQFVARRMSDDLYVECEHAFLGPSPTPAYDHCASLLLQLGKPEDAYWYLERKTNRSLHDALKAMDPHTTDETTNSAVETFAHDRAHRIGAERQFTNLLTSSAHQKELLAEVKASLDLAGRRMADASDRVVKSNPALDPYVRVRTFGVADIQRNLPQGTALVQYALTVRSVYAIVVTASHVSAQIGAMERSQAIALGDEYISLLRTRTAFADSALDRIRPLDLRLQELSAKLSEAFVRPLESALAGSTGIIVILPPELPSLPIHALRMGPLRTSPFVAERVLVSYVPDAITLFLHNTPPAPVHDVVGMGCPGETSWDVEYELRDIRAFYKDARLYFGQQATLATLQKEHGDILHLAVEYRYLSGAPANSFILLSDGQSGSGTRPVFADELFSIPPYAAVVISNLTDARVRPAEPYPFLAGRTGSVIMNSYVPSRKTKKYFGEVFYTALLAGSSCPAAYRNVQEEMIRNPEYSAPYVWAPFFLWGK